MAIENLNQSGASAAADSAKEEPATQGPSAGPEAAAVEPRAAAETTQQAPATQPAPAIQPTEPAANADSETGASQDFSAMLENYEKETAATLQEGEIVRGTVVGISDQNVLVDIGYKSEGVVAREEFTDRQGNLTVKRGDEVYV